MVAFFAPFAPYVVPTTMIDVIKHLGLLPSLQLCLDASDGNSYDGTSQTWTDISGNGNHFYRGAGSGSDAQDPTFAGVAGRQSSGEYFSTDGGDGFWATAAHSFMDSWHKDNATFSVAAWVYMPSTGTQGPGLLRNLSDADFDIGTAVTVGSLAGRGTVIVTKGNDAVSRQDFNHAELDTIVVDSWLFAAVSFSEGSGASFSRENAYAALLSSDTYTSPSAAAPYGRPAIWGYPGYPDPTVLDTEFAPSSGTRINSLMAWNRALSQAEITSLYDATKAKFGF